MIAIKFHIWGTMFPIFARFPSYDLLACPHRHCMIKYMEFHINTVLIWFLLINHIILGQLLIHTESLVL